MLEARKWPTGFETLGRENLEPARIAAKLNA